MQEYSPFAVVDELSAFWRPIQAGAENARALLLLTSASDRLRAKALDQGIDLDQTTINNPVLLSNVKFTVMEAVKRAMQVDVNTPPVDTYAQAAGPYSENYKYTNPGGDLYFKASELADIGLGGKQTLSGFSTAPLNNNIYGDEQTEVIT